MTTPEHARISEESDVIVVTLCRPEKLNPISPAVTATLYRSAAAALVSANAPAATRTIAPPGARLA